MSFLYFISMFFGMAGSAAVSLFAGDSLEISVRRCDCCFDPGLFLLRTIILARLSGLTTCPLKFDLSSWNVVTRRSLYLSIF